MDLSEFRNLDYIVLLIIGISVYFAYQKGFIESFVDFFAWVGSAFIVFDNYNLIFDFLNIYVSSKFICGLAASLGTYVAMVILISMFGVKIINFCSKFVGSPLDKVFGVVFGVLRGAFVALVLFWSLYMTIYAINDQKLPEWLVQAKFYKPLKMGSDGLVDVVTSAEQRENLLKAIAKKSSSLERDANKDVEQKNDHVKEVVQGDKEIVQDDFDSE